jgi:hypothetical protein
MSMLQTCTAPGCKTLTLGPFCLEHETAGITRVVPHRGPVLSAVRKPAARAGASMPRGEQVEATTES